MDTIATDALTIRTAVDADADGVWAVLEPVIREGETYALNRDMTRDAALAYWFRAGNTVYVAVHGGRVVGTYFLRANQEGGGAHVANAGYMVLRAVAPRGTGRALALHSLGEARARGFEAMQFNFVVSSNAAAVHLWQAIGFEEAGRIPGGFTRPNGERVDALIMYRPL